MDRVENSHVYQLKEPSGIVPSGSKSMQIRPFVYNVEVSVLAICTTWLYIYNKANYKSNTSIDAFIYYRILRGDKPQPRKGRKENESGRESSAKQCVEGRTFVLQVDPSGIG